MDYDFELVCAQEHPELIDECIDLLNSEWPRSKTARLVSIEQGSSEGFPTTLLLVNRNNGSAERVVAHCKVSPVSVYHPSACFVESVVVAMDQRGKGIGRIIMDKMEVYVKCRGIRTIFLTTHDQQGFYEKLGYTLCEPVVIYGGKCNNTMFGRTLHTKKPSSSNNQVGNEDGNALTPLLKQVFLGTETKNNSKHMPPPPPPPPLNKLMSSSSSSKRTKKNIILMPDLKVTMKKEL